MKTNLALCDTPSQELLAGRRALDGLPEVTIIEDWKRRSTLNEWVLHCRLTLRNHNEPSDWYVVVSDAYPWGGIKFFPAKENGIVQTYQHQNYNGAGKEDSVWRTGDLCLNTPARSLGRKAFDIEPFDAHNRLRWHFRRALGWLEAAAKNELAGVGDHFELPHFPTTSTSTIFFHEDAISYTEWEKIGDHHGIVDFSYWGDKGANYIVKGFRSLKGEGLLSLKWGNALRRHAKGVIKGLWLRVPSVLIMSPWQAPFSWGELRDCCSSQGVDVDSFLRVALKNSKDASAQILLLGFPIPEKVGGVPQQLHWQPIKFPSGLYGPTHKVRGFRQTEQLYWQYNRQQKFQDNAALDWLDSENWNATELLSRGALPNHLTPKSILILGSGALGSAVAELLVRAGIQRMLILDADFLEAGNLGRHTLTLKDIGRFKSLAVAERLNDVSPHTVVKATNSNFSGVNTPEKDGVDQCDIIIDCTGSDELLIQLEKYDWGRERIFLSASFGFAAKRLFLFTHKGKDFPFQVFREQIAPWLRLEMEEKGDGELPREGIGCWHPVFPARCDDIWLWASIVVKHVQRFSLPSSIQTELQVLVQKFQGDFFSGVQVIPSPGRSDE